MSELHRRTELAREVRECPNCLTMGGHWKECPKESGWVSRALEAEAEVGRLRGDVERLRAQHEAAKREAMHRDDVLYSIGKLIKQYEDDLHGIGKS